MLDQKLLNEFKTNIGGTSQLDRKSNAICRNKYYILNNFMPEFDWNTQIYSNCYLLINAN